MAATTLERIVSLEVVMTSAWTTLLLEDDARDEPWFSMYQRQQTLKEIVHDLFHYLLAHYNEFAAYDYNAVKVIVTCSRPKSTAEEIKHITQTVYRTMSEHFGLPRKGYRLHFRIDGRHVRFFPRRSWRYHG